eukprot:7340791-Prymnesium_polylepis.1
MSPAARGAHHSPGVGFSARRELLDLYAAPCAHQTRKPTYPFPLTGPGDRREVASEHIQRPNYPSPRVPIALRGPRGVCGGVSVKTVGCRTQHFRAVAHILPPDSEATRA